MFFAPQFASKFSRSSHRGHTPARRRKHAAARWLAVVLYGVLSIGLPIPAGSVPVTGEIFPCMHHRCGCSSAEQCWRDCCCLSLEERLAWAKEHDVTVPDYVLAEARSRGPLASRSKPKCCCCRAAPARPCCEPIAKNDCCEAAARPGKQSGAKADSVDGSIVLLQALKCRGISDTWVGVGISLPPDAVDFETSRPFVGRFVETAARFHSWAAAPPTPPPRSRLA